MRYLFAVVGCCTSQVSIPCGSASSCQASLPGSTSASPREAEVTALARASFAAAQRAVRLSPQPGLRSEARRAESREPRVETEGLRWAGADHAGRALPLLSDQARPRPRCAAAPLGADSAALHRAGHLAKPCDSFGLRLSSLLLLSGRLDAHDVPPPVEDFVGRGAEDRPHMSCSCLEHLHL